MYTAATSSSTPPRAVIDLTHNDDATTVHGTTRELQLEREVAALRRQLQQQQQQQAPPAALPSRDSAQSALVDFLADPRASAAEVDRFLHQFPSAVGGATRLYYETLLDDVSPASFASVVDKIRVLQRRGMHCPREVWRMQRKLESITLMAASVGEADTGRLLACLYESMAAPRPVCADLYAKLDGADLLLVACAMHGPLGLTARQQRFLPLVHYARHGPTQVLVQHIGVDAGLVGATHNGFPLLFQPLIEMRAGWLDRMRVLLEAGAPADAVYEPWNATTLHMLCYTKPNARRPPESLLVQAAQLLVSRGCPLNVVDAGSARGVHQRTALMQAASDGRFGVCTVLLAAGADAELWDSNEQSALDILFYLKHSRVQAHRAASAAYSCMDLYGLVNRFHLGALLDAELRGDCRECGTCRYLLATVPDAAASLSSSDDEEDELEQEEDEAGEEQPASQHASSTSISQRMSIGARMHSIDSLFKHLRV